MPRYTNARIGRQRMPLREFLLYCADSLNECDHATTCFTDELRLLRDQFLRAGVSAVTEHNRASAWVQVGVRPVGGSSAHRQVAGRTRDIVEKLLLDESIDNFFFMHKPPGIRLRFETRAESSTDIGEFLSGEIGRWRREGLVDTVHHGVYEPESQLFGGALSMQYVHALFTIDSIAWLEHHAANTEERDRVGATWLISLAMLREVFDGMGIVGWEDLGVWDLVRKRLGRSLHAEAKDLLEFAELAAEIRTMWSGFDQSIDLHPAAVTLSEIHRESLRTAATQWRTGYFETTEALIGPRVAASFYVIFHWNRAAIPVVHQALLTEALAKNWVTPDDRS